MHVISLRVDLFVFSQHMAQVVIGEVIGEVIDILFVYTIINDNIPNQFFITIYIII
jgi:hypothetical protein